MRLALHSLSAIRLSRGRRRRPACVSEGEIVLLKIPKAAPLPSPHTSRALHDFFSSSDYALGIVRELKEQDEVGDQDGSASTFMQLNAQVEFLSADGDKDVWLESGWTFTGTVEAMEVDWTYGERLIEDRIQNPHGEHAEGFYEILHTLPFECGSPILRE